MKLLLDTHVFLWVLERSPRLSAQARAAINDEANAKFISFATLWEVTIKASLGKLELQEPWLETMRTVNRLTPGLVLPFAQAHLEALYLLPFHHRDPFDRMLVAQAMTEELQIVSNDAVLDAYEIVRVW
jgi:PIN domain nuclease of toxin-antitoxin system